MGGQINGRLLLSEGDKATLTEIARRLGRIALEELAAVAKPDTLLAWYQKLIANAFGDRGALVVRPGSQTANPR